jgi:hypothetical protein
MFCWVELGTTDAAGAKGFYGPLFGWDWNDMDMGGGQLYTMIQLQGRDVAAMYNMPSPMMQQGVPPHWMPYVAVADAAATMEKAKGLGARVLYGPHTVSEAGVAGGLQDPQGAAFGIWQANKHIGASLVREHGTMGWSELATSSKAAAREFYTKVFDWGMKVSQMGPVEYTEWKVGDISTGGMLEMTAEWAGIPPHWMPYFEVNNCEAIAGMAKTLGGAVKVPPQQIPNVGIFSVMADPQGAHFSVIQLTNR